MGSRRFRLSPMDWRKVFVGFGLAMAGAASAWVVGELVPALQASADPRLLILAAVLSAAINLLRKWMSDTS